MLFSPFLSARAGQGGSVELHRNATRLAVALEASAPELILLSTPHGLEDSDDFLVCKAGSVLAFKALFCISVAPSPHPQSHSPGVLCTAGHLASTCRASPPHNCNHRQRMQCNCTAMQCTSIAPTIAFGQGTLFTSSTFLPSAGRTRGLSLYPGTPARESGTVLG